MSVGQYEELLLRLGKRTTNYVEPIDPKQPGGLSEVNSGRHTSRL